MAARSKHSQPSDENEPPAKSRAKTVKPGRLAVSEATFDRAGAPSPFGEDVTFPMPVESLNYEHPEL
jgi:succinate dehydrogenase / fumarate reductase, iron-sulfur subunit